MVDNSEKYRTRNSVGVVISGPLYRAWDVDDVEHNSPSYIPDEGQLEQLVQLIRDTNILTKMDSRTKFRQTPGRTANEVGFLGFGGELDHGDNTPDHDPWWVQIGG